MLGTGDTLKFRPLHASRICRVRRPLFAEAGSSLTRAGAGKPAAGYVLGVRAVAPEARYSVGSVLLVRPHEFVEPRQEQLENW
jgi:hypothetical protein